MKIKATNNPHGGAALPRRDEKSRETRVTDYRVSISKHSSLSHSVNFPVPLQPVAPMIPPKS